LKSFDSQFHPFPNFNQLEVYYIVENAHLHNQIKQEKSMLIHISN